MFQGSTWPPALKAKQLCYLCFWSLGYVPKCSKSVSSVYIWLTFIGRKLINDGLDCQSAHFLGLGVAEIHRNVNSLKLQILVQQNLSLGKVKANSRSLRPWGLRGRSPNSIGSRSASKTRSWTENSVKFLRLVWMESSQVAWDFRQCISNLGGSLWHSGIILAFSYGLYLEPYEASGQFSCFKRSLKKKPTGHTVGGTCHPSDAGPGTRTASRNGQVLGPKKPLTGWAMEDLAGAYQRHLKMWSWCPKCLPKPCKCGIWSMHIYIYLYEMDQKISLHYAPVTSA